MLGFYMRKPVVRTLKYFWFLLSLIVGAILADLVSVAMLLYDVHYELVSLSENLV